MNSKKKKCLKRYDIQVRFDYKSELLCICTEGIPEEKHGFLLAEAKKKFYELFRNKNTWLNESVEFKFVTFL